MKLGDRIWMVFNRKPRGRGAIYFHIVGPWLLSGIIWTAALLGIVVGVTLGKLWVVMLLLAPAIFYSGVLTYIDYKYKYVDAIHSHYLQRRQDKLDKITQKEEK